jgi:glutathione S-transferase
MTPRQSDRVSTMSARYTLFVGSKNTSSWSLRPWLAMKMAELPFEEVVIALRTPETKANITPHSPSGKVPALLIAEKNTEHTVWDSLAICETLAERHPRARLWPSNAAKRAEARSVVAEMHSGFQALRSALSMEIAARHPTPQLDEATAADIARIVAIWTSALKDNGKPGGFLFGHFSIADAFYAPVATRFATYGIALPAPARSYVKRILALPAMREWTKAAKTEVKRALSR